MRHSLGNKTRAHKTVTTKVAAPPITIAGTNPNQACRHARLELTQFIRCADEDRVHGTDPTADLIGSFQLYEQRTNEHADHVSDTQYDQCRHRHPKEMGEAQLDGRYPRMQRPLRTWSRRHAG